MQVLRAIQVEQGTGSPRKMRGQLHGRGPMTVGEEGVLAEGQPGTGCRSPKRRRETSLGG